MMDIGAIGKMLNMARGQESLDQGDEPLGGAHGDHSQQGKAESDLLNRLMAMLQGPGNAQGGEGTCGSEDQPDSDQFKKMMAGAQGMEAMMPDSDNGRSITA